jgi:hypothetical protein
VQADPIKPTLKAPGYQLLKPKDAEPLLNVAFKFTLRRYIVGRLEALQQAVGRGLHSSAFRLNVSAFCEIGVRLGGAFRGYSAGIGGVARVCFVLETAEVELRGGRV